MAHDNRQRKTVYDPLNELIAHYSGTETQQKKTDSRGGTVEERLKSRIIDGDRTALAGDLDEALKTYAALDIINTILLEGMKTVGELFGSGQMQLPFVLQSAEVMKAAVAYLEPHMDRAKTTSKGTMVIGTVKGDVHDIGKNLVDIILTNNGYRVVNLGIKCPIETMLHSAEEHGADAIGMSGLLVKSTLIMKENLEVMNERSVTVPVILGGAALTRRYVEEDLKSIFAGEVYYARDAFDGLRLMETIAGRRTENRLAHRSGSGGGEHGRQTVGEGTKNRERKTPKVEGGTAGRKGRSDVRTDVPIPEPPFWGTKVVTRIRLEEVFGYVNENALIRGQWQLKKGSMSDGEYQKLLEQSVYPDYQRLKSDITESSLLAPAVVYGYFPCQSDGDDLVVFDRDSGAERTRFTFPRQTADRRLCLADYFASVGSGRTDVVAFQVVTMGKVASEHSGRLFRQDDYKEYLYFHGLSVEAAEALAELSHKKIREEMGIAGKDAKVVKQLFAQGYQGARYSFGYPACPNLGDQTKLLGLLGADRIGVSLTDEFQLVPEQSTTAIVVHHPEARYFTV